MAALKTVDDLRAAVVRRLESLPVLPGIAVIPEDRQNITTEIQKALGMGRGMVIIVYTGNAKNTAPAAPIPQCDLEMIIEIAEIPAINRGATGTKIPGAEVARYCVRALHQYAWTPGRCLTFQEQEYRPEQALGSNKKVQVVQYFLTFKTHVSFDAEIGVI